MSKNKKMYETYVSDHFGKLHDASEEEYKKFDKYYKKNFLSHLPSDKEAKILDFGCGMGHMLHFLHGEGYQNTVGIDLSPENLEICKKMGLGDDSTLISEDGFSHLKDKPEHYDVVIMNDVIEHIPVDEIVETMSVIHKSLKKNGVLLVKVVNSANPITGASSRYIDFTHTIGFTEESLKQLLKMVGFTDVEVKPQNIWIFNPVVNLIGRFGQWVMSIVFRLLFILYGRTTTKVFSKDIISIAVK